MPNNWEIVTRDDAVPVMAHAHEGIICVPGRAVHVLWDQHGKPLSTLLHEYVHVVLPDSGHAQDFWDMNHRLHRELRVQFYNGADRFDDTYGVVAGAVACAFGSYMAFNASPGWVFVIVAVLGGLSAAGFLLRILNPFPFAQENVDRVESGRLPPR